MSQSVLEQDLINWTLPDKPGSHPQNCRLPEKEKKVLKADGHG
jgi:hypothetical protein